MELLLALKNRARVLHKDAQAGQPDAQRRLRNSNRELDGLKPDELANTARRRHALRAIAAEIGLNGWAHLVRVVSDEDEVDFGKVFYPERCCAYWNIWSAHYDEASTIRADHGGFLIPYQRQFIVVDEHFIRGIGMDPKAEEWNRIRRDWIVPGDRNARLTLAAALVAARTQPQA